VVVSFFEHYGNLSRFAYGPDTSRTLKSTASATSHYFGGSELLVDATNPAGLLISSLHADVTRVGTATDYQVKDHLNSNRLTIRHSPNTLKTHNYSPAGQPLTSNSSTIAGGPGGGLR
jgi:hypothetical protein